jgi:prepilin-type N-terminal cleavage/methylation domain-containing protein
VAHQHNRRGFTLVELIIALLLGTVVLSAAISFLITHIHSLEGSDIRENVARNDRYVGALLRRDLQLAGVDMKSSTVYATFAAWQGTPGDTIMLLYIPYLPSSAPSHDIPASKLPPINPIGVGEGTCGTYCIDVLTADTATVDLAAGDMARIQMGTTRRLILITEVTATNATQVRITFTEADTLLHQQAGLGGILLQSGTYVQKVAPVVFYVDTLQRLMRAEGLNPDGSPRGEVVAYNVEQFDAELIFADGDVLPVASPADADDSNDFDDIVGTRVRVTVTADRVDARVNGGQLVKKTSEWRISPRNLRYEKNRLGS